MDAYFRCITYFLFRYLYLSVSSISMSPSFSSVWTLLPIFITLLFSFADTMRYLLDISFVMSSMFCISWALFLIRTTSSMHSRHPNLGYDVLFVLTPSSYLLIYLAISPLLLHTLVLRVPRPVLCCLLFLFPLCCHIMFLLFM